jgi:hypothetical protein
VPILTRRRVTDSLLSVGSLGVLIAAMAAVNATFREHVAGILAANPSDNFAIASSSFNRTSQFVIGTAVEYADSNAPMVLFASVAVVLLLLMLRP